jgi:hypothetical protein
MKTGLTEDGMLIRFLRSSFVLPVLGFVLPFSVVAQQPRPTPDAPAHQGVKPPPAEVAGIPVNYDEAKVGTYVLPDPLVMGDGKPVKDAKAWYGKRRPEIVKLFEEQQYGKPPGKPDGMSLEVYEKDAGHYGGDVSDVRSEPYTAIPSADLQSDSL